MKNKIVIDGEEFELPAEFVKQVKEKLNQKRERQAFEEYCKKFTEYWFIGSDGKISRGINYEAWQSLSKGGGVTSEKRAKQLRAIAKLMTMADSLNEGWEPDWEEPHTYKYTIFYSSGNMRIGCNNISITDVAYFKSEALAQKAIKILGQETIKTALGV